MACVIESLVFINRFTFCITGMKSIRQWLQNRFSSGEILAATEEAARTKKQRMITPDNIPEFVIPPQRLVPRHRLGRASSVQHELNNNMSSRDGANTKVG